MRALKIDQLTPKQFQRAYEKWCNGAPHYGWWDSVYEMKKEDGKALGFNIEAIYFSGFGSQGDGASWKGSVDLMKLMEVKPELFSPHEQNISKQAKLAGMFAWHEVHCRISARGHYSHSGTMSIEEPELVSYWDADRELQDGPFMGMTEGDFEMLLNPVLASATETCLKEAREYADDIFSALEAEYDYLTSEEFFRESAESNDWEFDEEGELL